MSPSPGTTLILSSGLLKEPFLVLIVEKHEHANLEPGASEMESGNILRKKMDLLRLTDTTAHSDVEIFVLGHGVSRKRTNELRIRAAW